MRRMQNWEVWFFIIQFLFLIFMTCLVFCEPRTENKEPAIEPEPIIQHVEVKDPEIPENANRIEGCTITYYCCEKYPHICGTGDGITATGTEATPGRTVAVDPAIIPYNSNVAIDYGDGIIHRYIAEDTGGAVSGGHIDVAVAKHQEALDMGVRTATVWWW